MLRAESVAGKLFYNSLLTVTNKIAYRPNQKKLYIC